MWSCNKIGATAEKRVRYYFSGGSIRENIIIVKGQSLLPGVLFGNCRYLRYFARVSV